MLNKIIVMGRMVRNPELRRTNSGTAVASFTIACDRDFKSDGGEREADFIECVAWRNTAEFVSKYFTKGRMAVVSGRLQTRNWTDKEGNKRKATEIVAESVYFGDSKRDGAPAGDYAPASGGRGSYGGAPQYGAPSGGYTAPVASSSGDFAEIDEEDGDLPF